MALRKDGMETHDALLEAALELFIEKGYCDATIAEICRQAGANAAAVNYHFGSKEGLYVAVWRRAFAEADRMYPVNAGVAPEAPAEQRLRGVIAGVLSRILRHGAQSRTGRLLLAEMTRPTEALDDARREATEPVRRAMVELVSELLGPEATDRQVRCCALSIMHQMLAIGFRCGRKPWLLGEGEFTDEEVDELIEHTFRFSMGGIEAIKQENQRSNIKDQNYRSKVKNGVESVAPGCGVGAVEGGGRDA